MPTENRPLAKKREDILALFDKRYPIYKKCADIEIAVTGEPHELAKKLLGELYEKNLHN